MPYFLDGTQIRSPYSFTEEIVNQYAQNKTLDGGVNRDYFGDLKRVWTLSFQNLKKSDYIVLRTIYNDYLTNFIAKTWETTEDNYTITQTHVHLNMDSRTFDTHGYDYLSGVTLILTEV